MNDIKKIVDRLIKKYSSNNPFELADYLNCTVIITNLDEDVRGFYQHFQRNRLIYINGSLPEYDQNIVCAHELGHAVLHTKLNILFLENNTCCIKNRYEREANNFAAELLIPDNILSQYPNYFNLEQIAASVGLPVELLKLKFKI